MRPTLSARLLLCVALCGTLALTGCSAPTDDSMSRPSASVPDASPSEAGAPRSEAPASLHDHGVTVGDGPVEVALWTDLSCPYCAMLEAETGTLISSWVADGDITLTIHPLNFVSAKHGDTTDWSTRAAGALAAVAAAGEGDAVAALYGLLQKNQAAGDGAPPTDEDILTLASRAGVTSDIRTAVETGLYADWVAASNDHWLGATIDSTSKVVEGVPILVIDGTVFEIGDSNAARLQAAVEASAAR